MGIIFVRNLDIGGRVNMYSYEKWIQHMLFIGIRVNHTFAGPGMKLVASGTNRLYKETFEYAYNC